MRCWGLLLLSVLCHAFTYAVEPPPWVNGQLPDTGEKASFYGRYMVVSAEGYSEAEAYQVAVKNYVMAKVYSQGVRTLLDVNGTEKPDVKTVADEAKIAVNEIARYKETNGRKITLYLLIWDTPNDNNLHIMPTPFKVVYEYRERESTTDAGAFLRSLVLPGWGHLYKGETLKGLIYMLATPATLGGAIYSTHKSRDVTGVESSVRPYWTIVAIIGYSSFLGLYVGQLIAATNGRNRDIRRASVNASYRYVSQVSQYHFSPWFALQHAERIQPVIGALLQVSF